MKVTATLKGRTDQQGRRAIFIRIADGSSRQFKVTDMRVLPKDFAKGKVKSTHPDHVVFNRSILNKIMQAERTGGFETLQTLSFKQYANRLINRWDKTKKYNTIKGYQSDLRKFTAFADVALHEVTPTLLYKYLAHVYEKGLTQNSAWKVFKFIRVIILRAVAEGLITDNPFKSFEMPKYKNPKKEYLTEAEIKALQKIEVPNERVMFALNWFIIGCYTGIRFSDMAAFDKKKNIVGGRYVLHTVKTSEVVSLPLTDKLKALFEKVNYKGVDFTNTHFNRLLHVVDERLSAHLSRHSFGALCAAKSISQEVASAMLGHTSTKTTAIYYKLAGKRIDDEFGKL